MRRLLAALLFAAAVPAAAERLVDGVAAQVGNHVVLISEVREVAAPTEARAREHGATDEDIRQLYFEVLEQMIERALIRQVVERAEIQASDAAVDEAIAGIARENELTPAKLRESVEAQGMPYALYRERIRGEIEHARVINDLVASRTRVEEKELREIYDAEIAKQPAGGDEFLLRVLVATPQGDKPEARQAACAQVEEARARIGAGEGFDTVAGDVRSANPDANASQAWVHESELAAWMSGAVRALPIGAVSERIEADFGCGIVQLVEKRAFVPKTFDQAKEALHRKVFDERLQAEYRKLVERLRAQTYIERKGVFGDQGIRRSSGSGADPGF